MSSAAASSSSLEVAGKPILVDILHKGAERMGYKQIWRIAHHLEELPCPAPVKAVRDALRDLSIFLTDDDFKRICDLYAPHPAGPADAPAAMIDTAALVQSLSRAPLSSRRRYVVDLVMQKLDPLHTGTVTYNTLNDVYDVLRHPDVRSGARNEDEVLQAFYDNFITAEGSPLEVLSEPAMRLYCVGMSLSIKEDTDFELWCTRAFCLDRAKLSTGDDARLLSGSQKHSRQSRLLGEGRQHPLYTTTSEEYGKQAVATDYHHPSHGRPKEFTRNLKGRTGGATSMNM